MVVLLVGGCVAARDATSLVCAQAQAQRVAVEAPALTCVAVDEIFSRAYLCCDAVATGGGVTDVVRARAGSGSTRAATGALLVLVLVLLVLLLLYHAGFFRSQLP